ncbi:P-loop containing nucleoside triphosphate hydrolase protein [Powellomyces hirtus]|nr:P-loop containing nucleoside triphosphate hydrolase protein [Powellomyces hirtus]
MSRLTFSWVDALLLAGYKKPLEDKDVWDLIDVDKAAAAVHLFEKAKVKQKSFFWRLIESRKGSFLKAAFFQMIVTVLGYRGPFFMYLILAYLETPKKNPYLGWTALIGLFICNCTAATIQAAFQLYCTRTAMSIRSILVNEVYQKSLQRAAGIGKSREEARYGKQSMFDRSDDDKASYGKIVTIMSSDVNACRDVIQDGPNDIVGLPIEIGLGIAGLVSLLGWASGLVGLFVMAFTGPGIAFVYKIAYKQILASRVATDARTNVTNEAIQNIRVLKYFGWEDMYIAKILAARKQELRTLVKYQTTWVGMEVLRWMGTMGVVFVTFFFYTIIAGNSFTPAAAFTSIALLHQVGQTINFLPAISMWFLRGQVAFNRINGFLAEDDLERYDESTAAAYNIRDGKVGIQRGQFMYMGADSKPAAIKSDEQKSKRPNWFRLPWKRHLETTAGTYTPVPDSDTDSVTNPTTPTGTFEFKLRNVDVDFPIGKLSTVVGPTGCGKSSLLLALLGEMRRLEGTISLPDPRTRAVAYAAQTAFMMNATIRENILFGSEYEEARYEAVIDGCALRPDLKALLNGSETEIGEKGINLSGGQKQRISLARAAYSKASILLLDDPLSAVDASTARHLLKNCLLGLLKDRTTILVTHAVDLVLPHSSFIVCMKDGGVVGTGNLAEVLANPLLQVTIEKDLHRHEETQDAEDEAQAIESGAATGPHKEAPKDENAGPKNLVTVEGMSRGKVDRKMYFRYFSSAGGIFVFSLFIVGLIATQVADYGSDWWVKRWTESTGRNVNTTMSAMGLGSALGDSNYGSFAIVNALIGRRQSSGHVPDKIGALEMDQNEKDRTLYFLGIYGLFNVAVLLVDLCTYGLRIYCARTASLKLHEKLLFAVFRSPMRWFETTPTGRIINRFSKDMSTVDGPLIQMLNMYLRSVILIANTIIVIAWVVPSSLAAVPVVYLLYSKIGMLYVSNSREIKRLESVSSSPIYSLFGETLVGVSTIRAFGSEERLGRRMWDLLDANHRHFFYATATSQWFNMRCNYLSATFIAFVTFVIMSSGLSAAWAGLVLTYQTQLIQKLRASIQMHARLEMQMNAIERIEEYSQNEQEPPLIVDNYRAPPDWPTKGRINVTDLVMRYAPGTPDVLKGVTFSTHEHEKIGVVGRTGAGKSTLSLAFLRIVPIAGGHIHIDGIDIGKLGLKDLRTRLTIVPQDPVLFEGTIRSNLDPMEQHTDADLWAAVKSVGLIESLENQDEKQSDELPPPADATTTRAKTPELTGGGFILEFAITENGGNLSLGQRQLICLSRALLRKSRLVILDEATASIDYFSDALIQQAIRSQFKHATVLTIAHRLRTIVDYDRVLVLDHGSVAEYDSPRELMKKENGIFARMCAETGHMDELRTLASAQK